MFIFLVVKLMVLYSDARGYIVIFKIYFTKRKFLSIAGTGFLATFLLSCEASEPSENQTDLALPEKKTSAVASDGSVYSVDYVQASSTNKNPRVIKKDANGNQIWEVKQEESSVDGTAEAVALDGSDRPYILFTVDGGSNDNTYITKHKIETGAFDSAPFPSYGSGGGPKVTVVALLDKDTGKIEKATFLIARKSDGKTNTFSPTGLAVSGESVLVGASSYFTPPDSGATQSNWKNNPNATGSSPWKVLVKLTPDLAALSEVVIVQP